MSGGWIDIFVEDDEWGVMRLRFVDGPHMRRVARCLNELSHEGCSEVNRQSRDCGNPRRGRQVIALRGGHFVGRFNTLRECAQQLGIPPSRVCEYAQSGRIYKGGYSFKYAK